MRTFVIPGCLAIALTLCVGLGVVSAAPARPSEGDTAAAEARKRCRTVVRKVRGTRRRVRVCRRVRPRPPSPQPPAPPAGPPAGRVVSRIPLPGPAADIAFGEGAVWVSLEGAGPGRVVRIDPASNRVVAAVEMPEGEWAPWLAVGHGAVWISVARLSRPELDGTGLVVRVDSSTNAAVASIPVGRSPEGVAFTPDAVWVANHRSDATPAAASGTFTVSRVDPVANREIARVPVEVRQHSDPWIRFCCGPESAAAGAGSVWTGDAWAHSVLRIDPATNSVTARIEIADGDACGGMAADDAAVWIASGCDSFTLGRIDPATNGLTLIQLPGVAQDVALGLGSVWATTGSTTRSPGEVALVRVDPATNAVVGRTTVTGAGTLAVGGGAVWVTTGPELVRIEPAG